MISSLYPIYPIKAQPTLLNNFSYKIGNFTAIMISKESIQQILSRLDIIDIIGGFIKLKKRGVNYLGLCPFHNEKSPSFTVSKNKEIYKCFGCGKSGNTISFLMELEKYSYVEALRWLAKKYNITLEETELSSEQKEQIQVADSLYIINNFAQTYFSQTLTDQEEGKNIGLSYLKERGFSLDTITKFQLGYSLENRTSFATAALQKQFQTELLVKTGLVVQREHELIDNYRGRVIFPIQNQSGKIIGFGARILKKNDKAPKYINTPQNEIYDKSKVLYGLYFARHTIDKLNECFLVEGYTDVISLHQAGIENVVSSSGTSLTIEQLRLIKKFTKNLTILYDGDGAGIKAALRGLDLALEEGLQVKVVLIPDGEDPDSYVRKVGSENFRTFIHDNKQDVVLFQLKVSLQNIGSDSNQKSVLVNQVAETISKINKAEDFTRQQDYIRQCSQLLKIDEAGLHTLVNKFIREKISKENAPNYNNKEQPDFLESDTGSLPIDDDTIHLLFKDELQERNVVRALIEYGTKSYDEQQKVADYILKEAIDTELFDNKELVTIINLYQIMYQEGKLPQTTDFVHHPDNAIATTVVSLIDFPYEISPKWKEKYEMHVPDKEEMYVEDVDSSIRYLQLKKIRKLILENQIDLETETDATEQIILMETHKILKEQERLLIKKTGTVIAP
jgi:DNA primase